MIQKLIQLNQPYFHLVGSGKSEFERLFSTKESFECESTVIKRIAGCNCVTMDGLFTEFAKALQFPDYFGNNWPAFDECLNDLDWLSGEAYLLLIEDVDQVLITSDRSFIILINILKCSVDEWTEGRNYNSFPTPLTPFHIVFQCSVEKVNAVKERLEVAGLNNVNIINIDAAG